MKSVAVAYLLWLIGGFGVLGLHRFYLRKYGTGFLWMFTGGVFGIGASSDLFTLYGQVKRYNREFEGTEDMPRKEKTASDNRIIDGIRHDRLNRIPFPTDAIAGLCLSAVLIVLIITVAVIKWVI
ncbi:MAG: NINE protein [Thermoplasmatota archaeon]